MWCSRAGRWGAAVVAFTLVAAGCSGANGGSATAGVIAAVGAENQYANVISQIGGKYVKVTSILDNPNADPHSFETSPSVARAVSGARVVVQNGAGYDGFMDKIESAAPSSTRKVIVAQKVLGVPANRANPHLWYGPTTMPAVAAAVAEALSGFEPAHAAYFHAQLQTFDSSLGPWLAAISAFKTSDAGAKVATTEPVADDLLAAMGADNLTPFGFQADVMNGIDPAPQDITLENGLFTRHQVKVFCYNAQVVDALTSAIRNNAEKSGIPVVAVYETMPVGDSYQSWMLAETQAIHKAVASGISTEHL
ncbi:MAG: metal ABC transporter solute-binding protein, Zn/Mn family [Acidimicrobiales bacterium]